MSDYFLPNMERLSKKNLSLATAVRDIDLDCSFEIQRAESGHLTVRQHAQNGTYRFIHSNVDPVREARTWVNCQSVDNNYAAVLGIGLAYHVAELRHAFPRCKQLLLVEAVPALFRLAMEFADLSDILSDPRVHVSIVQDLQSCEQPIAEYPFASFSCHPFLPAFHLHPEPYNSVIRFHEQQLYKMRSRGSGDEDCSGSLGAGVQILLDEMRAS